MLPLDRQAALRRMMEYGMTFYPKAEWQSGPADKQNGGTNRCTGVVLHSMVGLYRAALGELQNPLRRASWHYSVLQSGRVIAHYHDEAQTWHAGSARNNDLIGIEHEGGFTPHNEPLTPKQLAASVDLVRWLSARHGFPMTRKAGLFEHNEVSDEPTACPSRRIPWAAYTPVEEDDDMKPLLVWDSTRKQVHLVGPFGAVWITQAADVAALSALYGPMTVALTASTIDALAAR